MLKIKIKVNVASVSHPEKGNKADLLQGEIT